MSGGSEKLYDKRDAPTVGKTVQAWMNLKAEESAAEEEVLPGQCRALQGHLQHFASRFSLMTVTGQVQNSKPGENVREANVPACYRDRQGIKPRRPDVQPSGLGRVARVGCGPAYRQVCVRFASGLRQVSFVRFPSDLRQPLLA